MEPWVIRWKDRVWRSEDQTGQVLQAVAFEYGGDEWASMSPWNGPLALSSWLTVLFLSEIGDPDAARLLVNMMKADELVACLSAPEPVEAAA